MPASEQITIAPHLAFDAITAGTSGAPLVLLLHGFAESMHCWRTQVACLGDMGYRAIAPSQRGYSPGARPDPREFSHYLIDRLMDDAMAIAAAAGYSEARFHLVGHDWGGSIAWGIADRHHERLASLTILSRPHPNAFNRALMADSEQAQRSKHHKAFLEADAANVVLADNAKWLRDRLAANGVPKDAIGMHLAVLGNKQAMEAALAWYRARGAIRSHSRADALYLGRRRRHRRPRRRRRHGRFHRRTLSLRGASGRGAFRGGSGAGAGVRTAAGTSRRASGLRNATRTKMLSCTKRSVTTWLTNNPCNPWTSLPQPGANRPRNGGPPSHNNRKSPRRCRTMVRNWCGIATPDDHVITSVSRDCSAAAERAAADNSASFT
ncbi:alpha/beta fold hydrolase [Bradyrhizobium sp. 200]|uniref:alpha/beta fold hydrolase n=1 Tax=Bradyrhizobium sp. 200 TaxID=2782665 RepID=UPI001FFEB200|nr:alpha/beta fold hydrolase [Bradyrhizobium sp. 200]UPJ52332.1 alpha/beta fold hydrolase [Bradyrhizobium sp. 200]